MELAINLTYRWAVDVSREAERLGFDLVLAPEGFRSDAVSVLGAVAGATRSIGLATGVLQIPARAPGMVALTAATLDALSEGRFRLGLGVSNPDISEGWYAVDFAHPLRRTREYVDVVRMALSGAPVRYEGEFFGLPTGALRLATQPRQAKLPIYLAAVGPRSLALAGEIADGWVGVFASPERVGKNLAHLAEGRTRAGKTLTGFNAIAGVPTVIGTDLDSCADQVRGYFAHFLGMGSQDRNIYRRLAEELGHGPSADLVHKKAKAGDIAGAAAAVPLALIDEVSLIGPVDRVATRMRDYASAGTNTLALSLFAGSRDGQLETVRAAVRAAELAGLR